MEKNKKMFLTRILYGLFVLSTLVIIFIVYKDIGNDISVNFLLGYSFFAFFMLIYIPVVTIVNARSFKWAQIKVSIVKFISILLLFTAITYGFDYLVRPTEIDLVRNFSTSLGLSFSIAFFDIIFLKEKI
ncbi:MULTISPECIES: hypothetical protein [Lactobacillales]|uniref:Uncharacterized protein n=1 Tax=Vagococcus intermedius TaxID=2991418 RepID=A0AAF0IAE6_9ENTE|nr:hypothetical protein [Vagococcus intermedius]WEG74447.1 hypothetical protein OL234_10885 [Vagococcus intermedius]WEG76466.1 hypothetical protein OL235_10515 [Vagococcus intermedius]